MREDALRKSLQVLDAAEIDSPSKKRYLRYSLSLHQRLNDLFSISLIYIYILKIEGFVLLWNESAAGFIVKLEDFCIIPLGSSIIL